MKKSRSRIVEDFDFTCREYSVCKVVLDCASPARETDYAVQAACFLEEYRKNHDFPGPDMAELVMGETQISARDWDRRRLIIEAMLRRSGFVATPEEMLSYRAKRKAQAEDLLAHQAKYVWPADRDDPPVEIHRERRHGRATPAC